MKKRLSYLLLALSLSVFMISCASTKIDPSTLEGTEFQITSMSFVWTERDNVSVEDLYNTINYEELESQFSTNYGLELKHDLFTADDAKNFVTSDYSDSAKIILGDEVKASISKLAKETDLKQYVHLTCTLTYAEGVRLTSVLIYLPNGKNLSFDVKETKWTNNHVIVDKENAAIVELKNGVFLQRVNNENAFAYCADNCVDSSAKDKAYYFAANEDIELLYGVYEKGNAFVAGGYWSNQTEKIKLEKGKHYVIGYEIDRKHFLQADWTVSLKITEK